MKLPKFNKSIVVYLIVAALAVMAFLAAMPAGAATYEARVGADWMRLTDAPCTDAKVLALLGTDGANFSAGTASIAGTTYNICWMQVSPEAVGVVYDDGDTGVLALEMFSLVKEG